MNDYAGILSAGQRDAIDVRLRNFETQTTSQVVLLTVPSLDGEDLEGFSIRVAEQWKIGRKGQDNGAILLVVPGDRKVRIEVGYGLEGTLTDAECDRILRQLVLPAFKNGSFYEGISAGLSAIMRVVHEPWKDPPETAAPPGDKRVKIQSSGLLFLFLFFFLFLARFHRFSRMGRMGGRTAWGGRGLGRMGSGGFGGFGGGGGSFGGGGGSFGGGGASGRW